MRSYAEEKRDADAVITELVKQLSVSNKLRVADILTGMVIALSEEKPRNPHGIRCG